MCGIIGYIGSSDATPILLDGLRRLEYRGYDSAGIATLENGEMELLEGALKLKEISYKFAEGHPSAELKHGVIALIGPDVPSIMIAPDDAVYEKNISSIEQIKARKGKVIAVATEGRKQIANLADDVICIPKCPDFVSPILTAIPLQLFAYHLAVKLDCDVDKPRNLAKSVTVE